MANEPDYAWALPLAVERLNAECKAMHGQNKPWAARNYGHPTVITVAKQIAKHEQPPVDPAEEAAVRFLNDWESENWTVGQWKTGHFITFPRVVQTMREILAEQVKP